MDRAAVINNNVVENVIMIAPAIVDSFKEVLGCEYLIPVDDTVEIGDLYDPQTGIFTRDGVRVYPDLSVKERIDELEAENSKLNTQVAQLENAVCELDETNAERFAAIEDALCEIDMGG